MDEMNVQNASEQSTTSAEMESQQEVNENEGIDTAPKGDENASDTSANENADGSGTTGNDAPPFLEIQYNHEKRGLSRDEAAKLAQKGIYYQSTYDALERVATLQGKTVDEFINAFETEQDEAYRRELAEKFGNDEETINIMMEHYQAEKGKKIDAAKNKRLQDEATAEQNINTRLANEFIELQKEFPELTEFADLPESVRRAAAEGKDLTHAYLLHQHRENKKIAAAKASEEAAAAKSAGSMADNPSLDNKTSAEKSYLKGLWGR